MYDILYSPVTYHSKLCLCLWLYFDFEKVFSASYGRACGCVVYWACHVVVLVLHNQLHLFVAPRASVHWCLVPQIDQVHFIHTLANAA